jgi:catechol 2,3-dioxygenase-like lactoylglutathione lyase family enzyme
MSGLHHLALRGLHHLALRVADPELSARFYGGLLGLPELRRHLGEDGTPRAVWLALGDAVLMLERSLLPPGPAAGSAHVLVLAAAQDDGADGADGAKGLDSWARRLAAAGVAISERTAFTLYFQDPDGHRLGVSTFRFAGL